MSHTETPQRPQDRPLDRCHLKHLAVRRCLSSEFTSPRAGVKPARSAVTWSDAMPLPNLPRSTPRP
jgi:hypothetical protein